ncbi:MAG: class I SAM-dependent methyltransferase [Rhodospirillaceae bacterium]|nr:class I SAM-dependent methyltransferase [Rhodospirillaceae bacterium]
MNENYHHRDTCRLCGGKELTLVISLEPTPPANAFVPKNALGEAQECYPLDVYFCENCAHVQLLDVVDPKILFEHYVYVSGTSPVFVEHFRNYAADVMARFGAIDDGFALDIGSNDGTLLSFFKEAGWRVLGIDPAKDIAMRATQSGIETMAEFFTPELAAKIKIDKGPAKVITANNVFAHADDLQGIVSGINALLADDGIFVFEVSYLLDVMEKTLFDTIYHEHLAYHSVKPLAQFLDANNMELIDAQMIDSHGGSLRAVAQKKGGPNKVSPNVDKMISQEIKLGLDRSETFKKFAADIESLKNELGQLLRRLKGEGKSIAAFGAPAKATTLMYHFDIGADIIDFIVDDSPLKQGLYSPGMHIEVVSSEMIKERNPDYLLILAWNFAQPIMEKQADFKKRGGHFIVPLPKLEVF